VPVPAIIVVAIIPVTIIAVPLSALMFAELVTPPVSLTGFVLTPGPAI
jgi:hypothetical protein